ncbi:MAG: hypothetical protein EXR31_03530 [Betaproteobacteria bacterium]|nr:hypothetical protein [Betaproteobacteria bacterium]
MDSKLKGKVAIVTDAARDVGREIALALGAEGAIVAVNCHKSREGADAVAREIKQAGGERGQDQPAVPAWPHRPTR